MYLLDTNVLSELRKAKSEKADPNVVRWVNAVNVVDLYISAITVLELEKGILLLERKDQRQGQVLRRWFDEHVLPTFDGRILSLDVIVALRCAQLHVPDPASDRDTIIAATAWVHGMTVVTRNVQDFVGTSVALINPWAAGTRIRT